jgi:hypothetical protein
LNAIRARALFIGGDSSNMTVSLSYLLRKKTSKKKSRLQKLTVIDTSGVVRKSIAVWHSSKPSTLLKSKILPMNLLR